MDLAALLAAIVLLTMFVVPAVAAPKKPYAAVISPSAVAAGSTPLFTATLTNETSTQQLGSANLTLPAIHARVRGNAVIRYRDAHRGTVQLRNLSMAPGSSVSVSVSARVPCPLGTYTWSIIAKQANDFSGDPGNDLTFNQAHSSLTTTLTGTCHLGFVFTSQPANAQVATAITTLTFDPSGFPRGRSGPRRGRVPDPHLDGSGHALDPEQRGRGDAVGHDTVNAVGGAASFPGISSTGPASATPFPPARPSRRSIRASAPIQHRQRGKKCSAAACSSGTVTQGITSASEVASAGADGDLLSLYVAVEPLDCPGYQETSSVVTFDVTGSRTKSVTITLPKTGSEGQ